MELADALDLDPVRVNGQFSALNQLLQLTQVQVVNLAGDLAVTKKQLETVQAELTALKTPPPTAE